MDANSDLVPSEPVMKRDKLSPVAAEARLGPIEILVNNASLFSAFKFGTTLSPKTITVFLDASLAGKKRAAHAASLAQRWRAHLVAIHAVFAGVVLPASMCSSIGYATWVALLVCSLVTSFNVPSFVMRYEAVSHPRDCCTSFLRRMNQSWTRLFRTDQTRFIIGCVI